MGTAPDPAIQLYQTLGPYLVGAAAALVVLGVSVAIGVWVSLSRASKALAKQAETQRYQVEVIKWLGQQIREHAAASPPQPQIEGEVTKVTPSGARPLASAPPQHLSLQRQLAR